MASVYATVSRGSRFVSLGNGKYSAESRAQISGNLVEQGFAPEIADHAAAEHAYVASSNGREHSSSPSRPTPKAVLTDSWNLPKSQGKL